MSAGGDAAWARFYDQICPGLPGDVEFYVELARAAAGPVLEIGCGTGRVLCPVAAATPHPVYGLDLSTDMLDRCRARVADAPSGVADRVTLLQEDMTQFVLPESVALVLVPYRAFHHVLTVDAQLACLARIRAALAPGGLACINCFDPRLDQIALHGRDLDAAPVPRVDFVDDATGHAIHVATAWREWDAAAQTFREVWTFSEFDGQVPVAEHEATLRLRYGFRWEMEHLFRRAGFAVEALYGDFQRNPHSYGAEQVWLLR